mgnify:CR=1 FL=1
MGKDSNIPRTCDHISAAIETLCSVIDKLPHGPRRTALLGSAAGLAVVLEELQEYQYVEITNSINQELGVNHDH